MELQRLVVEDSEMALAVDFHSGLTVAFHENPAVRARFIDRLIDGLGPGHPGVHLELTDAQNRHLAVFRPHGNRHRVIDIDSAQDISAQYASPDDRVDVLGRAGLDGATVLELIRMTAQQVDGGSNTGTDNHRLARQLAGVDQKQLWEAAAALRDAESLLATCAPIASTDAPTEAPAPTQAPMTLIGRTQELRAVAELHDQVEIAARSRRSVRTFGFALAALCSGLATVLFLLNGALDDGNWTAKALAALAVVAAVLTIADGKSLRAARQAERAALTALNATTYEQFQRSLGITNQSQQRSLFDAAGRATAAADRWEALAGDSSVHWALANRAAIEALAARRQDAAPYLVAGLVNEESTLADSARVLVDRVVTLRDLGMTREPFPLLLEEPFVGLGPKDLNRLLETVRRLATHHQILLVTGDPLVQAWAERYDSGGQISLLRIGVEPRPQHQMA